MDLERIRGTENGAKTLPGNLAQPIPVLIVYATAVTRATGEVDFFDDIYGHDAALDELLRNG
jgi:murein L,D-transpeptidase YcbB/YkuD